MFPPKRTRDVEKYLDGLLSSLIRAGLEAHVEIKVDPVPGDDSSFIIRVPLLAPVPTDGWPFLRDFLKQYSEKSGWYVEKIRQARGLLLFTSTRA